MKWKVEADWKILVALEALAEQELADHLHSPGHWISLIKLQQRLGKTDTLDAIADRADAAFAGDVAGRKQFVSILFEIPDFERAMPVAEALVAAAPGDAEAQALLERAIVESDRWTDETRRAFAAAEGGAAYALSLNQSWHLAETEADFRAITDRCRTRLAENPVDTDARCFLAHALAWLGEDDAARDAMAIDTLVRIDALPTPGGFGSPDQFRAVLAAEIRRNVTLVRDPKNRATRDGLQTAGLGQPGEPAVAALIGEIRAAVECYAVDMAGSADPFIASAPETVRITQWAVIYDGTGYQTSHRHPSGWLSGVYYVSAPRDTGCEGHRGALLVGAPQSKVASPPPWGIRKVEPVPGRIVLFPSFVTHATEPCGVDGERISVAFDIMPVEPSV